MVGRTCKIIKEMRKYILLTSIVVLVCSCGKEEGPGSVIPGRDKTPTIFPPGVVVSHAPKSDNVYFSSPAIEVLPDGSYIISHDVPRFSPSTTWIYRSEDKGRTWKKVSVVDNGLTWASLFFRDGALYIMGMQGKDSPCRIYKSTDRGDTWSTPSVIVDWHCHSSSVPVVEHNGRLWRGLEVIDPVDKVWPRKFNAMILSMDGSSDITKSSSWVRSNKLAFNPTYLGGLFGGWLEGNAVPAPDGTMKLIMRVEVPTANDGEYIAIIDVSEDGKSISFDPENGFVKMPGGAKKFCIRYDEVSKRYWTLSNYVKPQYKFMNPGKVRNTLSLCSSEDLRTWTMHKIVLEHEDVEYHGFQYVDWRSDGDDMVFVSRTSHDDGLGGAASYHDSNFITFHRVENFRSLVDNVIEY